MFLKGEFDMSKREGLNIGNDVPCIFKSDLEVEHRVTRNAEGVIASYQKEPENFETLAALTQLDDAN